MRIQFRDHFLLKGKLVSVNVVAVSVTSYFLRDWVHSPAQTPNLEHQWSAHHLASTLRPVWLG